MHSPVPAPFTWHLLGVLVDNDVLGQKPMLIPRSCVRLQIRTAAAVEGLRPSAIWCACCVAAMVRKSNLIHSQPPNSRAASGFRSI